MVFWNGLLFLALSVLGIHSRLVRAIPEALKIGIQTGIGLFIAFIGLKNAGLVQANEATFVTLGAVNQPSVMLSIAGLLLTLALVQRQIPGAILIAIGVITLLGTMITMDGKAAITTLPMNVVGLPASPLPILGQLDLYYPFREGQALTALPLILTFLFVDLFDSIGTLIGMSRRADLVDAQGQLPKLELERALVADSGATMAGACLGTFSDCHVLDRIDPRYSGSRQIVVGLLIYQGLQDLNWDELSDYFSAILAALLMPLTLSITHGIAAGFIFYCVMMLVSGSGRQVDWVVYLLGTLLILMFALQG
jgi:AGZA family xanthine/uracil permease-like MFS transporter